MHLFRQAVISFRLLGQLPHEIVPQAWGCASRFLRGIVQKPLALWNHSDQRHFDLWTLAPISSA